MSIRKTITRVRRLQTVMAIFFLLPILSVTSKTASAVPSQNTNTSATPARKYRPDPAHQRLAIINDRLWIVDSDKTLWQTDKLSSDNNNTHSRENEVTHNKQTFTILARPLKTHVKSLSVSAAYFTIDDKDILWGWGENTSGELLINRQIEKQIPPEKPVRILTGVRAINGEDSIVFAIRNDNTLWAWGKDDPMRGDNLPGPLNRPHKILDHVVTVVNSGYHALALKEDGTLWTWGSNECGGLGDGGMHAEPYRPFQIGKSEFKGKRILAITAWKNESYALTEDDTLWYWGHDNNGKPYCLDTPVIVPEAVGKTTPQKIKKLFYTTESAMYGLYGLGTDNTLYKLEPGYTASTSQNAESEKVRLEKIAGNVSQFIISRGELAIEKTDGTVWIKNDNPYDNERFFQILFVRPPENGSPAK